MAEGIEREVEIECLGGGKLRFHRPAGVGAPVQIWILDGAMKFSMMVAIPREQLILATVSVCEE